VGNKSRTQWTEVDFGELSWHDNHVHGLRILEGEHGSGELVLDIDHIVEWLRPSGGQFRFRIAPTTLTFREIRDLRIEIDYVKTSAGIVPPSVDEITREAFKYVTGVASYRWIIKMNWTAGTITFTSPGFTQRLRAEPVVSDQQCLAASERG
jgi:hypothetical protein